MSDLVKRLERETAASEELDPSSTAIAAMREAAARITELEHERHHWTVEKKIWRARAENAVAGFKKRAETAEAALREAKERERRLLGHLRKIGRAQKTAYPGGSFQLCLDAMHIIEREIEAALSEPADKCTCAHCSHSWAGEPKDGTPCPNCNRPLYFVGPKHGENSNG